MEKNKSKYQLILIYIFLFTSGIFFEKILFAIENKIILKVNDQIITSVDVFNEGEPSGTAGFLRKVDLPESFYVMNGDTFFSGDMNLDCDESTIFVAEENVTHDVGYIQGKDGKVEYFVEKDNGAWGKKLVSLGVYKLYRNEIEIPNMLPISMEYDILPKMELSYKIIKTDKFDIGTPERLEKFREWVC